MSNERVVCKTDAGNIRIWDLRTEQCKYTLIDSTVCCKIFTSKFSQENIIYTRMHNIHSFVVWNSHTQTTHTFVGHSKMVCCVEIFFINGTNYRFVSGSHDTTLKIWTLQTKAGTIHCDHTLVGHTDLVACIAVLIDHTKDRVVSGSYDKTLKIWDIQTGKCEHTLIEHNSGITCVTIIPDGRIACGSYNKMIKYGILTMEYMNDMTLNGNIYAIYSISLLPDGKITSDDMSSIRIICN